MNPLKAVVVDDERLARKEIIQMLKDYKNIEIVGEADNVTSAVLLIEKYQPDVIFLDIQMPGESGFDLINKTDISGKVIFVTAFDEFAIRAFDINALDYLLKPVNPARLEKAINRLSESIDDVEQVRQSLQFDDRLFLSINNKMIFVKVNKIVFIRAAGDYSEIFTSEGIKGLTLKTMKEWESRLPNRFFTRIHRSTIINMECIDKLEEWFDNSFRVYMKGYKEPLVISRRYVVKLKNKLR